MRRLVILCFAAITITTVGSLAAVSAHALPSFLALVEGNWFVRWLKQHLHPTLIINSAGATFHVDIVNGSAHGASNMVSLGTLELALEETTLGTSTCSTSGDASGAVLIASAEWHLVLREKKYFLLQLFPLTTISCSNGIKVKLQGSVLSELSAASGEPTIFTTKTECESEGSHKAKFKSFESDTGTGTAKLEDNVGLGFEEACMEIPGSLEGESTTMLEAMEP